jgi:thiol-disulfide isomerase/thioredoxin
MAGRSSRGRRAGQAARRRQLTRWALGTALVVLAGALVAFVGFGGSDPNSSGGNSSGAQAANKAAMPGFSLTELRQPGDTPRTITAADLRGNTTVVWFTTSWCEPCKVGAEQLAALDDELGGRAFDVLMVFVDPGEPPADILAWKRAYARDDWAVALDTDNLIGKVKVRALDHKLLVDSAGLIRDVDLKVVDANYLDRVRALLRDH